MKKTIRLLSVIFVVALLTTVLFSTSVFAGTKVADLTIFSDGSGGTFGTGTHAFISVKNTSSSNITVGHYTLKPQCEVTIGTWGNKNDHKGIWYNLEAYFINEHNTYSSRVSLTMDIDSSKLSTLASTIKSNDAWSLTNNCSRFASKVWNSVSSTKVSAGFINTPANLANSIKSKSGYQTTRVVLNVLKTDVWYANRTTTAHPSSFSSSFKWSSSRSSIS